MSKNDEKKKPNTAADAALEVIDAVAKAVLLTPVCWLLDKTVGRVLDLT